MTVKVHVPSFVAVSVAVHVTTVSPNVNGPEESGVHDMVGLESTLSVADVVKVSPVAVSLPVSVFSFTLLHVRDGASLSVKIHCCNLYIGPSK